MIIPGVHPFGPVGPVWWGVFNTPLHGYDHSGHRPAPWYGHLGPWGPFGGVYAIRPYPDTLTAPADAGEFGRVPRQLPSLGRGRPQTPRRVGKLKNAPLNVSEASESVKTRR